jgi:hypothetical protein
MRSLMMGFRATPAIVICEDEWMARLADPIENIQAPPCLSLVKTIDI